MTPVEDLLLKYLVGIILIFGFMIYVLAFAGPQWLKKKLLAKAPEADRKWFKDMGEDWETYRLLPEKGLKSLWKFQKSSGISVGEIEIYTWPKNGNLVVIEGLEFRFFKLMKGMVQDGFIVRSSVSEIWLEGDRSYGPMEKFKTNFRPLKSGDISIKGIKGRKLEISRNGKAVGQIMFMKGSFPRLAAISKEATQLEKAVLVYCGLSS